MSEGDQWFFTMELIKGVDILTYLRSNSGSDAGQSSLSVSRKTKDGFPFLDPVDDGPRLRKTLKQLASGVLALHQAGILHRDIKPSNVLVSREGRVALLDFGLPCCASRLRTTPAPHRLGRNSGNTAIGDPL